MEQRPTSQPPTLDPTFNDIMNSPNGVEIVEALFKKEREKMNRMDIKEFLKYEPLYQYDGQNRLGVEKYRALATEYFHRICLYDPLIIVDMNDKELFTLPPIFNRFNPITDAGDTGCDINQAFINVGNIDDPMVRQKLDMYTKYYKQLINIVNDEEQQNKNIEKAKQQGDAALAAVQTTVVDRQQESEVQEINPNQSLFKEGEVVLLSDNNEPDDRETYEPL